MSKLSMSDALKAHRTAPKEKPEKIHNATARPVRRGRVGVTFFLDVETHREVKRMAFDNDTSIDALIREGVNLMLQSYGKKPTA